ncbi:MAG: DNA-binding protein [Gammaproteobacteria bacterium]|nr:DNA-binding protein [Gammaproteobacteria bacterium]
MQIKIAVSALIFTLVLGGCAKSTEPFPAGSISPGETLGHLGETATVCGEVASGMQFPKLEGEPTYINIGKPFPNQDFTVLILGKNVGPFDQPLTRLKGKNICVTGLIVDGQSTPLIELVNLDQLVELN